MLSKCEGFELNIPNSSKILGHVGTFSKSKNQQFILNILKEIINSRTDIYVVFVGEGPLKKEIETEAKRYKLENHVRFLGVRNDIARLMQAFDVLLFPSIFEGFGIVTIEAQSLGTPCIASNNVTTKTDMGLGIIKYLALNRNVEEWIQEISNTFEFERQDQEEIMRHIVGNGYNIIDIIPEWLSLYGEI
ncbi:glycosyltransferase [Metabacillus endolithicus]|uniref:glycosyltransferase n=1 Tax=Metabacillus endolithicus TaxID=1535204 RepID=UPI001FF935BB|nr:glycosyltransferase [Metabacillus endolithicus]UPG64507.1 glycosyltransferase [Metabacillus endolithicus]